MKHKELYSAPECESVQVKLDCIIAASPVGNLVPENPFTGDTEVDW